MKPIPGLVLAAAVVAASVLAASPVLAEGTTAEKVAAFKEYLKTKPEAGGLKNQIAELGGCKDKAVVDVLMPLVRDPKMDEEVKVTILQTVGKQGDKAIAATLLTMIDSKPWEEKPKLIAAALEGVGDADAAGRYDDIIKLAKKYLDSNGDIAIAGYKAASLHVSRESVDDFIKELGRSDYTTNKDSAPKRAARAAAKPAIIECLKKMTGKNIDDVKVWVDWWNDNKKTWVPPGAAGKEKPKDLNASDKFVNDAPPFEISKPNKVWTFREGGGNGHVLTIEASDDGQRAAWVEVIVQGTKNLKSKTPELYSKEVRETLEAKFRDLKVAEWEKKSTISGQKAIEQILHGQHKELDAVHMRNCFVEEGGVMFALMCTFKTGKKASLETDIDTIIASFKIKK